MDQLMDKYEGRYFEHWLAMYHVHQDDCTRKSIERQIELYKSMEGNTEFQTLKDEVDLIVQNNDLALFLEDDQNGLKMSDLELMATTIVTSD